MFIFRRLAVNPNDKKENKGRKSLRGELQAHEIKSRDDHTLNKPDWNALPVSELISAIRIKK